MMTIRMPGLFMAACLTVQAAQLSAQTKRPATSPIKAAEIDAHLRFLSSDLLEGRAPGTRGGKLAAEYIASQLMAAGLQPAGERGTYFQQVPISVVGTDQSSVSVKTTGK